MVGELIANRYRVLELLRTSGMARTYRGLDEASNEEVALLLVPVPPEPRHLLWEFAIGSRLSHPSLLQYRGTVESGDCAGLVVEPVVGLPLYARMSQRAPVAVEQVNARAFHQLCEVVDYLHSENLVHGNLTPDNLLVQRSGSLKLLDLGHCEDLAAQERFWHGEPHGTPRYSSPEHFSGPLAPESDYFVVGVLLCEYLSGAHPFQAHTLADVLSSIRAGAARAVVPRHLVPTALAASVRELLDLDFAVRRAGWQRLRQALSGSDLDVAEIPASSKLLQSKWAPTEQFDPYAHQLDRSSVVGGAGSGRRVACPCCRFLTLGEHGGFDICPVCFWEDDGQDDHDAGVVRGGPNGGLSLERARANYAAFGACEEGAREQVRPPRPDEQGKAG